MKYKIIHADAGSIRFEHTEILNKGDKPDFEVMIKWDGCADIHRNYNDPSIHNDDDYIHICDIRQFVKDLQDMIKVAEEKGLAMDC